MHRWSAVSDMLLMISSSTYFASGRLGKPESPGVGKWVLDVEVLGIVEDSNDIAGGSVCSTGSTRTSRVERLVGHCDFGHDCECCG